MGLPAINFDTLSYAKSLCEAGCDPKIAEVHAHKQAEVINMLVEEQMVTKADVKNLETEMKLGFADVKHQLADIRTTIENMDKKFEHKFEVQDEKTEQRFKVQDEKIEQRFKAQDEKMEQRFKAQDEKMEQRFKAQDEKMEQRFKAQDEKMEQRFKAQDEKIEQHLKVQDEKIEQHFKIQDEKIGQQLTAQDDRFQLRLTNLETNLRHDMKVMSNTLLIKLSVLMSGIIGLLNFLHRFQVI